MPALLFDLNALLINEKCQKDALQLIALYEEWKLGVENIITAFICEENDDSTPPPGKESTNYFWTQLSK